LVAQAARLHAAVTENGLSFCLQLAFVRRHSSGGGASIDLETFCNEKIEAASDETERSTWTFIRNLSHANPRAQILDYLGYAPADVQSELQKFVAALPDDAAPGLAAQAKASTSGGDDDNAADDDADDDEQALAAADADDVADDATDDASSLPASDRCARRSPSIVSWCR
jgi:hypothetical protein